MLEKLPSFRGDWLAYTPVFSLFDSRTRVVSLSVQVDGKYLFDVDFDPADPPQYAMLRKERYDFGTALVLWFLLKDGDVSIDVGANHGYLSCIASQKVGDSGLVISLEPGTAAFRHLVRRRHANVISLNLAAADKTGQDMFLIKPFYRSSSGSFCVSTRLREKNRVRTVSLDHLYQKLGRPQVRFVKVDTEGMELMVLKGAEVLLRERHPYVMVEIDQNHLKKHGAKVCDLLAWMQELGYEYLYRVDNSVPCITKVGNITDADALFSVRPLSMNDFSA